MSLSPGLPRLMDGIKVLAMLDILFFSPSSFLEGHDPLPASFIVSLGKVEVLFICYGT